MMCSTASSMPRFSDMPDNITRRPSAPRLANDGLTCPTVSAKPSRSRAANHVLARCGGAPSSSNLPAIGRHVGQGLVDVEHQQCWPPQTEKVGGSESR
jgi:hypothetical protein